MKRNYIAPVVESVKIMTGQVMAGQSGVSGNNQEGDGPQLSKEHDYFEQPQPEKNGLWDDEE